MDMRRQIGQRIRLARERLGLAQADLAQLIGKNASTVSNYESGARTLPITDLPELARVLDVPIDYFFNFPLAPDGDDGLSTAEGSADVIASLQAKQRQQDQQLSALASRLQQLEESLHELPLTDRESAATLSSGRLMQFIVEETTLQQLLHRFGQRWSGSGNEEDSHGSPL